MWGGEKNILVLIKTVRKILFKTAGIGVQCYQNGERDQAEF